MSVSSLIVDQQEAEIEAELSQLRTRDVSWVREDFVWALAEPRRGTFNWAPTNRLTEAASRTGVHACQSPPSWPGDAINNTLAADRESSRAPGHEGGRATRRFASPNARAAPQ